MGRIRVRMAALAAGAVVALGWVLGSPQEAPAMTAKAAEGQALPEGGLAAGEAASTGPAGAFADFSPRPFHGRKGEDLMRNTGKECRDCHTGRLYPQGDFFGWEASKKWRLHWALFSLSAFVGLSGVFASLSIWSLGRSPSVHHPFRWSAAGRALVLEVLLGLRIWRQSRLRWAVFFLISMGFTALGVVFAVIVATRYIGQSEFFLSGAGGLALDFLADLLGLAVLAGCLLALLRRGLGRKAHLRTEAEDIWILLLLTAVVLSGFFLEAARLAVAAPVGRLAASFVGFAAAQVLKSWDLPWVVIRFYVWIAHAALVFVFFAYVPFSKLFHVMACPVTILATASEASYRKRQ